jgi:SAM-dependent methyltransferase
MPNDVIEQTRLLMYNEIYYDLFGNRNTTIPLYDPQKILDIGTGTGEWAMAMGEEYPEAEVIGTDIAKIQPDAHPLNVFFEIDDAEEEWTRAENDFDMVHFRYMCGAFADWQKIYREAFRCLTPGGWIEVIDFDNHHGVLQYFGDGSEVHRWLAAIGEGSEKSGRPRTIKHLEPEFLADLGFTDVKCTNFDIPLGPWRDDKEGQTMGKHFLVATISGIEAVALRVLSEQIGWEYPEIKRICEVVKEALWKTALDTDKSKGMGFRVNVLTGRKPGASEEVENPSKEAEGATTPRTTTVTETNNESTNENVA